MKARLNMPVFVCEIETGDIEIYYNINELKSMVEEFWDILEVDFKFWDKDGYIIHFEKSFLDQKEDNYILRASQKDDQLLRSFLIESAKKKGGKIEKANDMSLLELGKFVFGDSEGHC